MRSIQTIAYDIKAHWTNVNIHAKPYLDAMTHLNFPEDTFGADSAKDIVLYFLSNASTFRGEHAQRIKAELKKMFGFK